MIHISDVNLVAIYFQYSSMKSILCCAAVCALLVIRPAWSQNFTIIDSSPSSGTSSVPLETEVVFQFSDAVDINTDWNEEFFVEPRAALQSSRVFLGLDEQNRPAIVEFTVEHLANTDYVWLVYDVLSKDGVAMSEPYVLQYSTAPTMGSRTVSGGFDAALGKKATSSELLAQLVRLGQESGWLAASTTAGGTASTQALQDGHMLILLLGHFAVRSSTWDVKSATVVSETDASYTLDYVRDGTYWPLAVKYKDGTSDIEAVGFYDADGDASPDSVVVEGADRTAVDLTLVDYPRTTAKSWLDAATTAAAEFATDQELLTIRGRFGTTFEGLAYAWGFEFYSASENLVTSVRIDPVGATVDTSSASSSVATLRAIEDPFIDSDQALQIAEENGGQEFRQQYDPEYLIISIEAGNLRWFYPENPNRVFWRVEYASYSPEGIERISVLVDMSSGVVLSDEQFEVPTTNLVSGNYPNPFSGSTRIQLDLPTAGQVRLVVFNMLGQQIDVLRDEFMPAGRYSVRWDATSAPNGMYVYQVEVGGRRETGKMLLVD